MLTINKKIENKKAVLMLEGRLDTMTAPQMDAAVKEILPEITELILDFKDLEYISSAGLRILLSAHKAISIQGEMKICNVNETIMEIFEVTGFSGILNIE